MTILFNERKVYFFVWTVSVFGSAVGGYYIGRQGHSEVGSLAKASIQAPAQSKDIVTELIPAPVESVKAEAEGVVSQTVLGESEQLNARELKRRVDAMRALAARNPRAALAAAEREKNGYAREQLLQSVLRGWASLAPDEALNWAKAQPLSLRFAFISSAIQGAAETNPSAAIHLASVVMDEEPAMVSRYALGLVQSLVDVGEYEVAAHFILPGSPEWESRLSTCYRSWALHSPDEALAAAGRLDDPKLKSVALQNVVASWSVSDPTKALAYVETLPPGEQRREGFTSSLQQWATKDPMAALQWIDSHPPSADVRDAASAIATLPILSPQAALGWTDLIGDATLRTNARELVVFRWASEDAAAARRYVETSPGLSPEERVRLTLQLSPVTLF